MAALSPPLLTHLPSPTAPLVSAEGPTYGTAAWPAVGERVPIVTPFSLGGTGHVCCGQFRYYVLRNIPPDEEAVSSPDLP